MMGWIGQTYGSWRVSMNQIGYGIDVDVIQCKKIYAKLMLLSHMRWMRITLDKSLYIASWGGRCYIGTSPCTDNHNAKMVKNQVFDQCLPTWENSSVQTTVRELPLLRGRDHVIKIVLSINLISHFCEENKSENDALKWREENRL